VTHAVTPEADAAATTRLGAWILGVNLVLYFLCVQLDPMLGDNEAEAFQPSSLSLIGFGSSHTGLVRECGQYWRLVSANFLHVDLMHLLFNSVAVLFVVPLAAGSLGAHRTMVLYVLAGVGGFVLSHTQGVNAAGASAALCGMIAALAVYGKRRMRPELTRRMLVWGAMILGFGLLVPNIDNWGHGGGFLVGGALAWPASGVRAPGSASDRAWRTGAVAAVAVVLAVAGAFVLPSVVRMRQQRDVAIYDGEVDRVLKKMGDVVRGRAAADELPEKFSDGPAGGDRVGARMRAALEATRKDPSGAATVEAQREAAAAWHSWGRRLPCSHYFYSRATP
jgi:rhomboid protease GluP